MDNTVERKVTVYDPGRRAFRADVRQVIVESALVIGVNAAADYTIMRTPGNDRELVAGFLFTEGIINSVDEIMMLMECPDTPNSIAVKTEGPAATPVNRNMVVNSSCGLCGRADIDVLLQQLGRVGGAFRISSEVFYQVPKTVMPQQSLFKATGATHAAALFDETGAIFAVREDVGRHNAVDKVVGAAMLRGAVTGSMGLFLSGRASLELVVKAARANISAMLSVSAPTEAAIEMADKVGITLAGFARESGFTIYTHPGRIER